MTKRSLVLLFVSLSLASSVGAQAPAVPTLTDVQRLSLSNAVQRVEIAQLRLEKAVADAQALLKDLQRPGFVLDVQTLSYLPERPIAPEPAKE